jgi:hypothetical protein
MFHDIRHCIADRVAVGQRAVLQHGDDLIGVPVSETLAAVGRDVRDRFAFGALARAGKRECRAGHGIEAGGAKEVARGVAFAAMARAIYDIRAPVPGCRLVCLGPVRARREEQQLPPSQGEPHVVWEVQVMRLYPIPHRLQ